MHLPDPSSLNQVEIILKIFSCDTVDAVDTDNVLATQAGLITGWRCVRSNEAVRSRIGSRSGGVSRPLRLI